MGTAPTEDAFGAAAHNNGPLIPLGLSGVEISISIRVFGLGLSKFLKKREEGGDVQRARVEAAEREGNSDGVVLVLSDKKGDQ